MYPKTTFTRALYVLVGFASTILTAGVIFGFVPLNLLMQDSGVYQDLCPDGQATCKEQKNRLMLMYVIASALINVSSLINGTILDRFGPKVIELYGSVLFAIGCLCFSQSFVHHVDLYIPGYVCFAFGGPAIFLGTMNLSVLFPKRSNLIIALLTSAFDASSVVFYLFAVIYNQSNGRIGVPELFNGYLTVPIFIFVFSVLFMPMKSFQAESKDEAVSEDPNDELEASGSSSGRLSSSEPLMIMHGAATRPKGRTDKTHLEFRQQLKTKEFWLLTMVMSLLTLRLNYFIGTFADLLKSISTDNQISSVLTAMNILLFVGPFLSIVVSNFVLKLSMDKAYFVLISVVIVFGIFVQIPVISVQYVSIVIFSVVRSMVYTFCNKFTADTFGFKTFGRIYGTLMFIGGVFSFIQQLFNYVVEHVSDGSYFAINLALLLVTSILMPIFPLYLRHQRSKIDLTVNKTS